MLNKVFQHKFILRLLLILAVDAEECYAQVLTSLREVPGLPSSQEGEAMQVDESAATPSKSFIEQYMMGEMLRT